ncbi:MAG: LysE family translocator [Spirochaetales bacterium]|nr:LysE family translocator [Spirochaetales bacterium]
MTSNSLQYLAEGMLFGLAAGIAPGPLLTLVISETLTHSRAHGIKVALSPLFTDTPIILLCVFVLMQFSRYEIVLGILSFIGAGYIVYLGVENMRVKEISADTAAAAPHSLCKGIITNLLNPHPYLFWITVGAPLLIITTELHWTGPMLFLTGFYVCIIGAKITIALLTATSKSFLSGKAYVYIMRLLGILLLIFALLFIKEGLERLHIMEFGI